MLFCGIIIFIVLCIILAMYTENEALGTFTNYMLNNWIYSFGMFCICSCD